MRQKDSIDVTNRKPRRAKGTPFFKLRLQITAAIAVGCGLLGAFILYSPFTKGITENLTLSAAQYQTEQTELTLDDRVKQQDMFNMYNTILKTREVDAIRKADNLNVEEV